MSRSQPIRKRGGKTCVQRLAKIAHLVVDKLLVGLIFRESTKKVHNIGVL